MILPNLLYSPCNGPTKPSLLYLLLSKWRSPDHSFFESLLLCPIGKSKRNFSATTHPCTLITKSDVDHLWASKLLKFLKLGKAWVRKWFFFYQQTTAFNALQALFWYIMWPSSSYSSFCLSPPKSRNFKGQQKELLDLPPLTNFNRNLLRWFMEEKWNDRNIEQVFAFRCCDFKNNGLLNRRGLGWSIKAKGGGRFDSFKEEI